MWLGGYSDWTPAEQREWDRDLKELEAEREQRKPSPRMLLSFATCTYSAQFLNVRHNS